MTDHNTTVSHDFVVKDHASKTLMAIHGAAHKVSHAFDHASHIMGMFGTVAGVAGAAFSAHEMITGSMKYLGTVKQISDMTDMAGSKADGYLSLMKGVGISAEDASSALFRMTKRGQMMEMSMQGLHGQVHGVAQLFNRLGVNMEKGPEAAFDRMALLAKQGKLNVIDLGMAFHLPQEQAQKFMLALQKGPGAVAKITKELQEKGMGVTGDDIRNYMKIQALTNDVKELWERAQLVVAKKFLPVIIPMVQAVKDHMKEWAERAADFAQSLGTFIKDHGPAIIRMAKLMALNFTLMKATGMGMGGWIARGFALVTKLAPLLAGHAAAAGAAGAAGAGGAAAGAGAAGAGAAAVGLAPVIAVIAAIGAAVVVIAAGVQAIRTNFMGVRDKILALWERIRAHFVLIARSLAPVLRPLAHLFSRSGPVGSFFMLLLPRALIFYLNYVENFIHAVRALGLFFSDLFDLWTGGARETSHGIADAWKWITDTFDKYVTNPWAQAFSWVSRVFQEYVIDPQVKFWTGLISKIAPLLEAFGVPVKKLEAGVLGFAESVGGVLNKPVEMFKRAWDITGKQADLVMRAHKRMRDVEFKAPEAPDYRPPAPHYDFRNSRFDITQKFAEGFDPDRVAVAFTNDLATIGERRLQSAFQPHPILAR